VPLTLAALVSAGVTWIAWRAGTLTETGAIAGWSVGLLVLHGAGWQGGAVLAAFFIVSNLLSKIGPSTLDSGLDPKSDRRDLWQVYANGAPAAIASVAAPGNLDLWLVTASLAAAAADTCATALGTRSRTPPRLVWSGKVVPAGTSGGMSLLGSAGAVVGALVVAGVGALVAGDPLLLPIATLLGFAGMVADSILGGLLQGRFYCPVCDLNSEWRVHRCGSPTQRRGGLGWLNNDAVNFIATASAAGAAVVVWHWID
jgi:uncharacterized protein (TIGR00297 family)